MKPLQYTMALPHFPPTEIDVLLDQFRAILEGREMLSMGRRVREFEEAFAGKTRAERAIAVSSCSAALEIALMSLEIGSGDEVIVPAETFIATATAVARTGAKPVFAGIHPDYFCLSLKELQEKTTPKTRAVILVHMAGLITPEVFAIRDFCKNNGLKLIEDAAHAHGASIDGISAGTLGDVGCFSFFPTKIMTTGEGGMITTSNHEIASVCDSYRQRGLDVNSPVESFIRVGTNNRMTEFSALMGLSQLRCLDDFILRRNQIAEVYNAAIAQLEANEKVTLLKVRKGIVHSYWRYLVRLHPAVDRTLVRSKMREKAIAVDWAYDPPVHLQPVFRKYYNTSEGQLPETENVMKSFLCLPIHVGLTLQDATVIADEFVKVIKEL